MSDASGPNGKRRGRRLPQRAGLVLAAAALMVPFGSAPAIAAPPAATAPKAGSVEISIVDISPSAPARTERPTLLTVHLNVRNTTDEPLGAVRIEAIRGEPIVTQKALDTSLARNSTPTSELPVTAIRPATVDLPANTEQRVDFVTVSSILDNGKGLCQCTTAVYPLYFSAHITSIDGGDVNLGTTATYLPSFLDKVAPIKVSWVWPLIDRPHRLLDDAVFTDDALSGSVGGGRLDRALQVLEGLDPAVPITLVIDPELLDELAVMSAGKYSIRALAGSPTSPGTGQQPATDWLARLTSLLETRTNLEVALTPYADPDVQSLDRDDLTWTTELPPAMNTRVTAALAGRQLQTDVAWPPSGAVGARTLNALAASGASTLILDSASVSPSSADGIPVSVSRLATTNGPVAAALTAPALQKLVSAVVALGGSGLAALPDLTAELAIRAVQRPASPKFAVLTPGRYVDPSPDVAIRTIEDTSTSPFSVPAALRSALADLPHPGSRLRAVPAAAESLPPIIGTLTADATAALPALTALLANSRDARSLLGALPQAAQRLTSAAWRPAAGPFGPGIGEPYAQALTDRITALMTGVHIVLPSSGSYTLASSNSQLPITVENTLQYTVRIEVQVSTRQSLPGFTGKVVPKEIAPNSKQTIQIPTRVERSGRIPVQAQLSTPNGVALGKPVNLFVHSTVFGVIGVVITVIAGVVLILALLLRFARRVRKRRRQTAGPLARTAHADRSALGEAVS